MSAGTLGTMAAMDSSMLPTADRAPRRLVFHLDGVRARWAHAVAAGDHATPYGMTASRGPGLFWVKDTGTYLLSNGLPGEPVGNNATYAVGFGPGCDFDILQDVCGGDDFVEQIDGETITALLATADAHDARYLYIDVADDAFVVGVGP